MVIASEPPVETICLLKPNCFFASSRVLSTRFPVPNCSPHFWHSYVGLSLMLIAPPNNSMLDFDSLACPSHIGHFIFVLKTIIQPPFCLTPTKLLLLSAFCPQLFQ